MLLFNNVMHQKAIHSMHVYGNDNTASTSSRITDVTWSISRALSICIIYRSTSLSYWTDQSLNKYENQVYALLLRPLA